ncbi:MAG: RNA ligase family protein [Raoultibacter sp.]
MGRKLASVQYVHDTWPIEGADRIECIGVLGWRCVAKKGEFAVGDLCVYFEIDSFLPIHEHFEFLRAGKYRKNDLMGEGFRLRTQRFRGQISQGLALPLSFLPPGQWNVGDDVTETLGVRKWEIEERASSNGTIVADLPAGVPKTEEARIQAEPDLLAEFADVPYYITTKMDGTSASMFRIDGRFGVCGHNFEYADDGRCSFWVWAHEHQVEQRLIEAGLDNIVFQGEFCAGGIQGNPLKLKSPEWFFFTVVDASKRRRLGLAEMRDLCESLQLPLVPVEEQGESLPYANIEELLERAQGTYSSGSVKEGIVVRPLEPLYSPTTRGPLSFKVINNDYLVKKEKKH